MRSGFLSTAMSAQADQAAFSDETWKLLRSFNVYRLLIAVAAAGMALTSASVPPFGDADPRLFEQSSIAYLVVAVLAAGLIHWRRVGFESLATMLVFADIALLTLLMHASHGLDSGVGLLLLVAVAGASLMLGARLTILFAALATIAVGIEVNWAFLTEGEWVASRWNTAGYNQMGLLGIGLFATAALTHFLGNRLRATEALAQKRGVDLANLSQLNEVVIARMHSGVLVCDPEGQVHMMNKMARTFLGIAPDNGRAYTLSDVSPELAAQFRDWREKASGTRSMIKSQSGYSLLPRFLPIGERRDDNGILVYLEDASVIRQQAAQFKMAALARLTASVAHEIRNPLGAISHAAQLLTESVSSSGEDERLVRIIQDQARRMNVIIENVTQLSRRDKINPVRIQLNTWIPDFIRQFVLDGLNPPELFQAQLHDGIEVCFDPDQLQQVVNNLCTNALRHSPPYQDSPLIALRAGIDPDRRPFLEVVDRGKGVPTEILDSIFEPFFTTTPKGTGLGLYISRELCEGNGAQLSHLPGPGGVGACFRITFARPEECSELTTTVL
jgi:two-component system sensor histidine kinase PilS (NtrC family)